MRSTLREIAGMVLSHQVLSELSNRFRYAVTNHPLLLFGIRGSLPSGSTKIRPVDINYQTPRCTIGIWHRQQAKVFLFPGSTVPSLPYLLKNPSSITTCNVLAPGTYLLRRGIHPREPNNYQPHLAFLMDGYALVQRPTVDTQQKRLLVDEKLFSVFLAGDNLHASRTEPGKRCRVPFALKRNLLAQGFSSSGCITIVGQPNQYKQTKLNNSYWNSWERFNTLLTEQDLQLQHTLPFLLFEYQDIATPLETSTYAPYRYGACGPAVSYLQQVLREVIHSPSAKPYYEGLISGQLEEETMRSLLRFCSDLLPGCSVKHIGPEQISMVTRSFSFTFQTTYNAFNRTPTGH